VTALSRRAFLASAALVHPLRSAASSLAFAAGDRVLYNGIRLGEPWPPPLRSFNDLPVRPPYLDTPPAVIPIDLGRQLFVDDFLIAGTTLVRRFHRTTYHERSPVLRPVTPWERFDQVADRTHRRPNPAAMVFSDGVFYDAADRLFKLWYMGGYIGNTCFAVSDDGIEWRRPQLDVVPGTNIVIKGTRDSSTIWLDHTAQDPRQRFKGAFFDGSENAMMLRTSPDGIHWTPRGKSGRAGDRTTFFYNPFRRRWVFSLRYSIGNYRARQYWEGEQFDAAQWSADQPVMWAAADRLDTRRPEYNSPPELYNLDCVAYESVLLGLFTMWRGERNDREKPNDVCVGFSRDGFHWDRTSRAAFIPVSDHAGDWNWANVQSAGGCCLVVGDRLFFYMSARTGVAGSDDPGTCTTGLATLRRDGFASLEPPGPADIVRRPDARVGPNTIVTRPVRFVGRYLFVNADLGAGALRAQVEDVDGRPLAPFTLDASVAVTGDKTAMPVVWKEATDLGRLAGRPVRFRFEVGGRLYAFWVSGSADGASGGYVGAGGPRYRGVVDG
jgi:hypothetical protein